MSRERTRVKICGIREEAHARVAADAGADAVGLVFYRESPRYVDPRAAAAIARSLPPFVAAVGLFRNQPAEGIRRVLARVPLDPLQLPCAHSGGCCAHAR